MWHSSLCIAEVQRSLIEADFVPRSLVIWVKPEAVISRGHYHWQHEPCWYAVRKGATARWAGDRKQTTCWQIMSLAGWGRSHSNGADIATSHGTQKPVECMARPIRNHGAPGDIVYDPFAGTGTTLVAAHRLQRRAFLIDVEPRWVEIALRRAEAEGLSVERVD